jgi:dTDP-4-amino-4,6-dideoxygalactose transaminase
MAEERINVTKTFLPPLEEYEGYLKGIWERDHLTNQGPLLYELQNKLKDFLDVPSLHVVSNGTIALQLALRALDITEGEIITTPFSYVATTSAILWERCRPVFVDIEPETFCIDANKIEAAITKDTVAIMAVHVFGNPCDVEQIEAIAQKHNLKVIYDAAHAFGVTFRGNSLLSYGDVSICSFHATKVFHTIEGGCIIAKDPHVDEKIELLKRFGHNHDEHYMLGINAKASEFQAAMGLCVLGHFDEVINSRREAVELYRSYLGEKLQTLKVRDDTEYNYAYFPVVFETEEKALEAIDRLQSQDIFPRRYFYPSLNRLPYITGEAACPVSESIATRILCLPLFVGLKEKEIKKICDLVIQ